MQDDFINMGLEEDYTSGASPSVAVNKHGVIVEVDWYKSNLYSMVGVVEGGRIHWGSPHKVGSGMRPSVAIDDHRNVVEVHETTDNKTLKYRVGKVDVDNKSISWGSSHKYDDGQRPSVAINNHGSVVEVHETDSMFKNGLFYRVGDLYAGENKIHFNSSKEYTSGKYPKVALNSHGQVVEVHCSQGASNSMWFNVGRIDGKRISFGGNHHFDDGFRPSIALTDAGEVLEVHKSENHDKLYFHRGKLNGSTLLLGQSQQYGSGIKPAVAAADKESGGAVFVAVHERSSKLYYHFRELSSKSGKFTTIVVKRVVDGIHLVLNAADDSSSDSESDQEDDKNIKMKYLILIKWKKPGCDGKKQFELISKVSAKWRTFGLLIGLTYNNLDDYKRRYQNDASLCWPRVMQDWLDGKGAQSFPEGQCAMLVSGTQTFLQGKGLGHRLLQTYQKGMQ